MNSLAKLRELAIENNVSFEDLCVYALKVAENEEAAENQQETKEQNNATEGA